MINDITVEFNEKCGCLFTNKINGKRFSTNVYFETGDELKIEEEVEIKVTNYCFKIVGKTVEWEILKDFVTIVAINGKKDGK